MIAFWSTSRLSWIISRLKYVFLNPRLGNFMRCGVACPSKPNLTAPVPRAFCPLCPRPDVFPFPDPIPLPRRLLRLRSPLGGLSVLSAMKCSRATFAGAAAVEEADAANERTHLPEDAHLPTP